MSGRPESRSSTSLPVGPLRLLVIRAHLCILFDQKRIGLTSWKTKFIHSFSNLYFTGTYPFDGENIYKLFENIGKGVYEIPPSVDHIMHSLIRGMLEYEPKDRWSLKKIKEHDWFR